MEMDEMKASIRETFATTQRNMDLLREHRTIMDRIEAKTKALTDSLMAMPFIRQGVDKMHMQRIGQDEMNLGLAHLSDEVLRVRTELGLPTHPFDSGYYEGPRCAYVTGEDPRRYCNSPEAAHAGTVVYEDDGYDDDLTGDDHYSDI